MWPLSVLPSRLTATFTDMTLSLLQWSMGYCRSALETGVPCLSVSLTPHHYYPVDTMTAFLRDHLSKKGREAAAAVHQLLALDVRMAERSKSQAA